MGQILPQHPGNVATLLLSWFQTSHPDKEYINVTLKNRGTGVLLQELWDINIDV